MRVLFAGTPETALPSLRALLGSSHEVVAVLTRPDARSGRGRSLHPSPVKAEAQAHGIPVLEPARARDPALAEQLAALDLDVAAVVAYGQLVPQALLDLPRHGWINLHFSLLPAWRGAAPVQRAIMAGDDVTGASTFVLEAGLDTGPVLATMTETIRRDDTAGALLARLAEGGAHLLVATLDGLDAGSLVAVPQVCDSVSLAPKLTVEEAAVRWDVPAYAVDRQVRGCTPAPGAWSVLRGERVKIGPVTVAAGDPGAPLTPGELRAGKQEVLVGTLTGPVRLGEVRPHGKRPMPAADWARGVRLAPGERFTGGEDVAS